MQVEQLLNYEENVSIEESVIRKLAKILRKLDKEQRPTIVNHIESCLSKLGNFTNESDRNNFIKRIDNKVYELNDEEV